MNYPFYLFASHLLLPLVFARLLIKSRHNPSYRRRWSERLGTYRIKPRAAPIWIHTVSVGEFNAAKPLIVALQKRYPDIPLLITTTTPTGSAAVSAYSDDLSHVYLPYDLPILVGRFITHWQPLVGIIFETEIWPALFRKSATSRIPLIMANVRLSNKSVKGYRHIKRLIAEALQQTTAIAAATQEDAKRLKQLGAPAKTTTVMGNIKFDYHPPDDTINRAAQLRNQVLGDQRSVWIAASTHAGEEELILAAHSELTKQIPDALLILAPRHPERFNEVAKLCADDFNVARRSAGHVCTTDNTIYLADTMGELPFFYAAADAVFVGGSLVPIGGHNLIEPAAVGRAPVFGPHMDNFTEIARLLLGADGATQIKNYPELSEQIFRLLTDREGACNQGSNAINLVENHRGAVKRLTTILAEQIDHHY